MSDELFRIIVLILSITSIMGIYLVGFICGFLVGVNKEHKENSKWEILKK